MYFSGSDYAAESPSVPTGGLMSNYSSFGPTYNLKLKPQLSAPGGSIMATWPLGVNSGYAVISGTSMATPFMAGAYALIKSQKPGWSVGEIYALMQNSAGEQLPWNWDSKILSTTVHQGAGSLDVMQALNWESLVTPSQLSLGFANTTVTTNFTILNRSTRSKTYTFSHKPAGAMAYPDLASWQHSMHYPWYATVAFESESVLIKGGQSATVKAFVTPPPQDGSWKANQWPIYSGFLVAYNNYETYTVPYVGMYCFSKTIIYVKYWKSTVVKPILTRMYLRLAFLESICISRMLLCIARVLGATIRFSSVWYSTYKLAVLPLLLLVPYYVVDYTSSQKCLEFIPSSCCHCPM